MKTYVVGTHYLPDTYFYLDLCNIHQYQYNNHFIIEL